jgi:hypothetical protein
MGCPRMYSTASTVCFMLCYQKGKQIGRALFLTGEGKVLWARHEKSPEVDRRDGRVTMRMRSMLLLNTSSVLHTQTHSINC